MPQYFNVINTFPGGKNYEIPVVAGDSVRSCRLPLTIAAREGFKFVKETGNSWNPLGYGISVRCGFVPTIFLEPVSDVTASSLDSTAVTHPLMNQSQYESDESDIFERTELPSSEDELSVVSRRHKIILRRIWNSDQHDQRPSELPMRLNSTTMTHPLMDLLPNQSDESDILKEAANDATA